MARRDASAGTTATTSLQASESGEQGSHHGFIIQDIMMANSFLCGHRDARGDCGGARRPARSWRDGYPHQPRHLRTALAPAKTQDLAAFGSIGAEMQNQYCGSVWSSKMSRTPRL